MPLIQWLLNLDARPLNENDEAALESTVLGPARWGAAAISATAALAASLLVTDREDFPAPQPPSVVDEDTGWQTTPQSAQTYALCLPRSVPPCRLGDEEIPAGSLSGQPDEDYWQTVPAPQFGPNYVGRPFADTDDPAGSLFGVPEESEYRPSSQQQSWLARAFVADDDLPITAAVTIIDEDYWAQPASWQQARSPLAASADDDLPVTASLIQDEDFWSQPVPWAPQTFRLALTISDDDLPVLSVDESDWRIPAPWATATRAAFLPTDDGDLVQVASGSFVADDDSWQAPRPWPTQPVAIVAFNDGAFVPQPPSTPWRMRPDDGDERLEIPGVHSLRPRGRR